MIGVARHRGSRLDPRARPRSPGRAARRTASGCWPGRLDPAPDQLETVLALRPALVSVSFGEYAEPVRRLRDAGILTATQVCSPADLDAGRGGRGRRARRPGRRGRRPRARRDGDAPAAPAGARRGPTCRSTPRAGSSTTGGWPRCSPPGRPARGSARRSSAARRRRGRPRRRPRCSPPSETGYGRVFDVATQAAWPPEFGGRAWPTRSSRSGVGPRGRARRRRPRPVPGGRRRGRLLGRPRVRRAGGRRAHRRDHARAVAGSPGAAAARPDASSPLLSRRTLIRTEASRPQVLIRTAPPRGRRTARRWPAARRGRGRARSARAR